MWKRPRVLHQQLRMVRPVWRPQKRLTWKSVSIVCAWLFLFYFICKYWSRGILLALLFLINNHLNIFQISKGTSQNQACEADMTIEKQGNARRLYGTFVVVSFFGVLWFYWFSGSWHTSSCDLVLLMRELKDRLVSG